LHGFNSSTGSIDLSARADGNVATVAHDVHECSQADVSAWAVAASTLLAS
jgi:hypothetical protein